jgi:hypothetical protein
VPALDSTVARKLLEAGTVLLGKTNTHELAFGGTTNNPHYGPTRNPWKLDRIPGGSSGGSAAAIAAGLACGTTGTDTATSVRLPAAFCGVVVRQGFDVGLHQTTTTKQSSRWPVAVKAKRPLQQTSDRTEVAEAEGLCLHVLSALGF